MSTELPAELPRRPAIEDLSPLKKETIKLGVLEERAEPLALTGLAPERERGIVTFLGEELRKSLVQPQKASKKFRLREIVIVGDPNEDLGEIINRERAKTALSNRDRPALFLRHEMTELGTLAPGTLLVILNVDQQLATLTTLPLDLKTTHVLGLTSQSELPIGFFARPLSFQADQAQPENNPAHLPPPSPPDKGQLGLFDTPRA